MTLFEAKQINFPCSYGESAETLREIYAGVHEVQHEKWGQWYRNGDGQVRWRNFYHEQFSYEPKT